MAGLLLLMMLGAGERPPHTDLHGDPLPPDALVRLGTTRLRSGGWTDSLVFSTDGRVLYSTGLGGVFTWDTDSGRLLRKFPAAGEQTFCLAVSANQQLIAAWNDAKTVRLWSADGKERRCMPAKSMRALALNPDGSLLASSDGEQVRLWDTATGDERLQLPRHGHELHWLRFSADGKHLFTAGWDGTFAQWDVATARCLHKFGGRDDWAGQPCVSVVALAPDTKTLATCDPSNEKVVRLWDVATGRELRTLPTKGHDVSCLAFAPDGKTLATARLSGPARLWDVATGRELRTFTGRALAAQAVAFSPDGKTLATAGTDGVVQFWDPNTGMPLLRHEAHEGAVGALAYTPDGRFLATGCEPDRTLRLWDARTGRSVLTLQGHDDAVYCLAITPDGRTLISGGADSTIRFWDLASGREQRRINVRGRRKAPYHVDSIRLSTDGRRLTSVSQERFDFAGYGSTLIQVWDADTGNLLHQLPERSGPHLRSSLVAVASDGRQVAMSDFDLRDGHAWPYLNVCDVATGKTLAALHRDTAGSQPLAFSPDSKLLVTRDSQPGNRPEEREIVLWFWHPATSRGLFSLRGVGSADAAAFSPDGSVLAVAEGNALVLWEVATGKEFGRLASPGVTVGALAFAPDGRTLATGQADATAIVWDLAPIVWRDSTPPRELSPADLDRLWADLAGGDAPRAYRAIWSLAAVPERALPFLERMLKPATDDDVRRLPRLLADLDSDQFAVRDHAQQELERIGTDAEPALRRALDGELTPEARRRIEAILSAPVVVRDPQKLRRLRALQMLKMIGTDRARELLQAVSSAS